MDKYWSTNTTKYPPEEPTRDYFMPMINPNYIEPTYGPILAPNQAYNMLENMANSCRWPSEKTEFFDEDGSRTDFGAATVYTEECSSMEEKRFINNNGGYADYRDIFGEFATTLSKRMDYNEQKLDDLELHMVDLGARLNNIANQMCQIAIVVNERSRENVVDGDKETIESTPTYEEPIQSEYDEGRNGKEDMYEFHDNIYNLSYPQHHTQLFKFQSNQDLETFKKLPTNNCFVDVEVVPLQEDLKRKRIEISDKWSFNEKKPLGMENCASVARGQHEDLSTMGWSIDNIIEETPLVKVDSGQQCKRRVLPKYTRYFDPP